MENKKNKNNNKNAGGGGGGSTEEQQQRQQQQQQQQGRQAHVRQSQARILFGRVPLTYRSLAGAVVPLVSLVVLVLAVLSAYHIRMQSARVYGMLIHEFDPWFNFRVAEYMHAHGIAAFFRWYDRMSWYPLGRPVGSTTYPGLPYTAVLIQRAMEAVWGPSQAPAPGAAKRKGVNSLSAGAMSLNDVCVCLPAWFGGVATLLVAGIAYEATGRSTLSAAMAAHFFAILPAHTMRSMAGEFDNEALAIAVMLLTFYLWIVSLRGCVTRFPSGRLNSLASSSQDGKKGKKGGGSSHASPAESGSSSSGSSTGNNGSGPWWVVGALAGLAYGYMVATWGGYIFVLNMVVLHAGVCALLEWAWGIYNSSLVYAYTLFYVVGTALAVRVPPVGLAPFKSLEQLAGLLVLLLLWTLHASELARRRLARRAGGGGNAYAIRSWATLRLRLRFLCGLALVLAAAAATLTPTGYFGPLSSRVRALFVAHTRTGNPLVDSVAEHQRPRPGFFKVYLSVCGSGWAVGALLAGAVAVARGPRPAETFLIAYSLATYYFAQRMSRLVLLTGPAAAVCTGLVFGYAVDAALWTLCWRRPAADGGREGDGAPAAAAETTAAAADADGSDASAGGHGKRRRRNNGKEETESGILGQARSMWRRNRLSVGLSLAAVAGLLFVNLRRSDFYKASNDIALQFGTPQIVFPAVVGGPNGERRNIIVRDYLEGYEWVRDHTPADARVLAWWDYGYQITGIARRTSLADGNTWNHEHIATIGKLLTSPVAEAHALVRHLADYVLVWGGNQGDDLHKSPHMARIGNSVYHDICPGDPLCRHFGFFNGDTRQPTPTMRRSLLYNLHSAGLVPGVSVPPNLFEHVHTSRYGLLRVYKVLNVSAESKAWVADPANWVCEARETWMCRGQYPPAPELQAMLAKRTDFSQIEDFNRRKQAAAAAGKGSKYYEQYMKSFEGVPNTDV